MTGKLTETDVLIVGGGIAGLTATCALASEGFRVTCIDKAPPPPLDLANAGADLRTTAFLQPAIATLRRAGVWPSLEDGAQMLATMRLVDAGGRERVARETADFKASELQDAPFGCNLTNTAIRRALNARLADLPQARLIAPAALTALTLREDAALAVLADGRRFSARLVVGADGRDSWVRARIGIAARRWSYGQKTLVFTVEHDRPHNDISTEVHRTGGPFTLVPMRTADGCNRSSVVWMTRNIRAAELMAMPDAAFAEALNIESLGLLGRLRPVGRKVAWPIIGQLAKRMNGPRTALVAEAAHVIPPIGAQGLNLSFKDVDALRDLLIEARTTGADIGSAALLNRYHRRRWPDNAARVAAIDALNRAALAEAQPLRDLRRLGLKAISGVTPLRHLAMRAGMGADGR